MVIMKKEVLLFHLFIPEKIPEKLRTCLNLESIYEQAKLYVNE
jgi:hypothetical protein